MMSYIIWFLTAELLECHLSPDSNTRIINLIPESSTYINHLIPESSTSHISHLKVVLMHFLGMIISGHLYSRLGDMQSDLSACNIEATNVHIYLNRSIESITFFGIPVILSVHSSSHNVYWTLMNKPIKMLKYAICHFYCAHYHISFINCLVRQIALLGLNIGVIINVKPK